MKQRAGFTIIELLVVIVVIAILAAISVVAYTSIQDRAKSAQTLSAFDVYEKALRQYKAQTGEYPLATDLSGASYACLGNIIDQRAPLSSTVCFMNANAVAARRSTAVDNALLTVMSSLPSANNRVDFTPDTTTSNILYLSTDTGNGSIYAQLVYYIRGDQKCGRGAPITGDYGSTRFTYCYINL